MKTLLLAFSLLCAAGSLVRSSVIVDTTIISTDGKHKLAICIPDDYNSSQKYSLVVAIQPCDGSSYRSYLTAFKPFTDSLKFIVACPDNSGSAVSDANIGIVKTTIDTVKSLYNIDENQVYFTGMSCNGEVALRQGLKKIYPFKGIFPYAPYNPYTVDLTSDMPVVISVGTWDQYSYDQILSIYQNLKSNGANVNLVLIPTVSHTYNFSGFGNEMIHSINYLRDSGKISIAKPDDFSDNYTMLDNDAEKTINFTAAHSGNKEMKVRALSSNTDIIDNPQTVYNAGDGKITLKMKPKAGSSGKVIILLEVMENNGIGIKQLTFVVYVYKSTNSVQTVKNVIEIYPNPATDKLFIKSGEAISFVHVTDIDGRIVLKTNLMKESSIDISKLKSGCYYITVYSSTKCTKVKFLVK